MPTTARDIIKTTTVCQAKERARLTLDENTPDLLIESTELKLLRAAAICSNFTIFHKLYASYVFAVHRTSL